MKRLLNPWKKELSNDVKAAIIRWSYLIIVVAASLTMAFLLFENRQIVNDIQQDRKNVTYDLCLSQNARHDELIQFLKDEDASNPVAIKFVNLLAPKKNCKQVVINTFGSPLNESS